MSIDSNRCLIAGEHQITTRHSKDECPVNKTKTFDEIAAAQGWNADSRESVMLGFINDEVLVGRLAAYAQSRADEENDTGEPGSPLPNFSKDVDGECYGGAFWGPAEYRVKIRPQQHVYHLTVELADGSRVGEMVISDEEVEGLQRVASTDHGLGAFDDDWKIPAGMDRTIEWTLQTDINHTVRLDTTDIDEIAAWFRFATGEEVWDGGEDWEF